MRPQSGNNRKLQLFILLNLFLGGICAFSVQADAVSPFPYTQWKTYYSADMGLPSDHVFTIKSAGDSLWVGTEGGLALFENNTWKSWTEKEGLPWNIIMGIDVSEKTGDVWLASFGGGLIRFSGGRFDQFTQLNSGLVNDVLYGVAVFGDEIWVATAAGVSTYNTITGQWTIFNEKNAPMEEIWCYNIDTDGDKVYVAVWGGGILVWDNKTKRWNAHRDPDGEMEIDLYRDDGLVHNITTSVSTGDDTMWAATYFGLSRYDGRHWRGYMDHDSGLISNFINLATGVDRNSCLVATDKGLSILSDFVTDTWVTYKRENEDAQYWTAHINKGKTEIDKRKTNLDLPNHFVIAVTLHKKELWIGTGHGLARGWQ
jgi:ligand-binding sensor domain-containing protein